MRLNASRRRENGPNRDKIRILIRRVAGFPGQELLRGVHMVALALWPAREGGGADDGSQPLMGKSVEPKVATKQPDTVRGDRSDMDDGDTQCLRLGNNLAGAALAAWRLPIPDRNDHIRVAEDEAADFLIGGGCVGMGAVDFNDSASCLST